MPQLQTFFAVTHTSLYRIDASGDYSAKVVKIAMRKGSEIPVGEDIAEGGMVAICANLITYIPEKYGTGSPLTGYERAVECVNTRFWKVQTSSIVALFLDESAARACLKAKKRNACDSRWLGSTKQVLEEIGDDHPSFYISHDMGLQLLPMEKAETKIG